MSSSRISQVSLTQTPFLLCGHSQLLHLCSFMFSLPFGLLWVRSPHHLCGYCRLGWASLASPLEYSIPQISGIAISEKYTKKSLIKLLNLCIVPNTARLGLLAVVGGRRKKTPSFNDEGANASIVFHPTTGVCGVAPIIEFSPFLEHFGVGEQVAAFSVLVVHLFHNFHFLSFFVFVL